MKPEKPKPPSHLSAAAKKWWVEVLDTFDICDPQGLVTLALAAKSWDRCEQARRVRDKEGLTFTDRFGAPRARPEIAIERDSRLAFVRCIRELNLEGDVPPPGARPPRIGGSTTEW